MKKNRILYAIAGFMALVSIVSCEDYLDTPEDLGLDDKQVFTNYESFEGAIMAAYWAVHNYVYDPQDWNSEIGSLSDEAQHLNATAPPVVNTYNQGIWQDEEFLEFGFDFTPDNGYERKSRMQPAGEGVVGIRMVNLVLSNFDKLSEFPNLGEISEADMKNYLKGEAYVLRAWHYFEIIRRFGGIFYMDKPFTSEELIDSTRRSYRECTEWMVTDLDSAAKLLPTSWPENFHGRATKTSARAIKTMALLYAASPSMSVFDGGDNAYSTDLAQRAAEAALEAMTEAESSAFYQMYDLANYTENWYSLASGISKEALWAPPQSKYGSTNFNAGVGWYLPHWDGGWKIWSAPTQNAVDWFETTNGLAIQDDVTFDPNDPYSNRDPRLSQFVYKNGDAMYITPGAKVPTLESWRGGVHFEDAFTVGSHWTGYLHRKHRWNGANNADNIGGFNRIFPLIRYAQLYLDFAEAANEVAGPTGNITAGGKTMNAVQALNVVRNRVGMPDVNSLYTGSKDALRERIRNERAVELYQEMHRWHDLRRWRIAEDKLKAIYKAEIIKSGSSFTYSKKEIEGARVFEEKHYWYPFSTNEMQITQNFTQNPGW